MQSNSSFLPGMGVPANTILTLLEHLESRWAEIPVSEGSTSLYRVGLIDPTLLSERESQVM